MNSFEGLELDLILDGTWDLECMDFSAYLENDALAFDFNLLPEETDQADVTLSSDLRAVAISEEEPKISADVPTDLQEWLIFDSSTHRFRSPLLLEFIILLLQKPHYHELAHYTDVKNGFFIIKQPQVVAHLWEKVRNRQSKLPMTYDKFARGIRCYYSQDVFIKTNTRFTFQFSRSTLEKYCFDSAGRRTEIPEIQQYSTAFQLNQCY